MSLPEEKVAQLFQFLDQLSVMEDEDLLMHFTSDNIYALRELSELLREDIELERAVSEKRFVSVVRDLSETRRIWSERLDETLASAAEEFDRGNSVQALWILNGYIRFCPSPYYKEMAEGVMGNYEKE
jgi:hypothetical protein